MKRGDPAANARNEIAVMIRPRSGPAPFPQGPAQSTNLVADLIEGSKPADRNRWALAPARRPAMRQGRMTKSENLLHFGL